MVDFLTLVGVVVAIVLPIVVTIVALIIVVWQELNKQTNKFVQTSNELDKLNNFLKTIALSQIHEKLPCYMTIQRRFQLGKLRISSLKQIEFLRILEPFSRLVLY